MRTYLSDLLDVDQLEIELQDGYVRERHLGDTIIFNYTEKAQYEKHWNDVTLLTRGLIVDGPTGQVLARPFEKFFNYGELEPRLRMEARVEVTDKLDGSLGILYHPRGDGYQEPAIATRGSFLSTQAAHATEVLRERYTKPNRWYPLPGWTYLFEIIYPENRIVLDYAGLDDLVLLGAVKIDTGQQEGPEFDASWDGPRAYIFQHETLTQALAAPARPNAEGFVVRYPDTGQRVKIKQEDYVRLHKLVTGLNERAVWEHLAEHGEVVSMLEQIPDEFHGWVRQVAFGMLLDHNDLVGRAHATYHDILVALEAIYGEPGTFERKAFAAWAREYPELAPLLFQLLDGKDIAPAIWKMLKPKGETSSLMNRTEDNS